MFRRAYTHAHISTYDGDYACIPAVVCSSHSLYFAVFFFSFCWNSSHWQCTLFSIFMPSSWWVRISHSVALELCMRARALCLPFTRGLRKKKKMVLPQSTMPIEFQEMEGTRRWGKRSWVHSPNICAGWWSMLSSKCVLLSAVCEQNNGKINCSTYVWAHVLRRSFNFSNWLRLAIGQRQKTTSPTTMLCRSLSRNSYVPSWTFHIEHSLNVCCMRFYSRNDPSPFKSRRFTWNRRWTSFLG